jgi:hypothetical protein
MKDIYTQTSSEIHNEFILNIHVIFTCEAALKYQLQILVKLR